MKLKLIVALSALASLASAAEVPVVEPAQAQLEALAERRNLISSLKTRLRNGKESITVRMQASGSLVNMVRDGKAGAGEVAQALGETAKAEGNGVVAWIAIRDLKKLGTLPATGSAAAVDALLEVMGRSTDAKKGFGFRAEAADALTGIALAAAPDADRIVDALDRGLDETPTNKYYQRHLVADLASLGTGLEKGAAAPAVRALIKAVEKGNSRADGYEVRDLAAAALVGLVDAGKADRGEVVAAFKRVAAKSGDRYRDAVKRRIDEL